ncbi:MAG: hypothetical protein K0R82_2035 [Flavipsychrobacter sp.]|jgi:uncharacterized delta-60 repeat protein|nr:hypothetical protein [Flavipsychrobacter sp.]
MKPILLFLLLLVAGHSAYAQAGTLDPTFGNGGQVIGNFGSAAASSVKAITVQPDGKIVVVGQLDYTNDRGMLVARYNSNGTLDNSFDNDGWDTVKFDAGYAQGFAVALQPDGKIVVAGSSFTSTTGGGAIARFKPNGTLDSTFGVNGKVSQMAGDWESIVIQPDGKIVVAGTWGGIYDAKIQRLNSDGSPDMSFHSGTAFNVVFDANNIEDALRAVAVQPDGRIIAAGWGTDFMQITKFGILRLKTDGSSYDSSFAQDGLIWGTSWGDEEIFYDMVLQPDGKIVAGGTATKGGTMDMTVVRFNTDGTLDNSFGTGGIAKAFKYSYYTDIRSISLQSDGRIVAAGTASGMISHEFALARFNVDGSLDTSFDADGMVMTPMSTTSDDEIYATAIQPDGKIVAGGWITGIMGTKDYILVRYLISELGVDEVANNKGLKVYPNPGDGLFVVETANAGIAYSVTDAKGSVVATGTTAKEQTTIDLTKNANGMYLLQMENTTVKLVKQ